MNVFLSKGNGKFESGQSSYIGLEPGEMIAGDFNGDGALDLAVPNYLGGEVSVLLNRCPPK